MKQYISRYKTTQCFRCQEYKPYVIDPKGFHTIYSVYGGLLVRANLRSKKNG